MPRASASAAYEEEEEESDQDLEADEPAPGGKRTRKEPGKSTSLRKAQNRQAQREFRQRRLAYVRDLESRVQLLSSPQDDQVNTLRNAIGALVDENKQLRKLCRTLAGFIGDQVTGALNGTGLSRADLEAVFGRGETDTMHESFQTSARLYNLPKIEDALAGAPTPQPPREPPRPRSSASTVINTPSASPSLAPHAPPQASYYSSPYGAAPPGLESTSYMTYPGEAYLQPPTAGPSAAGVVLPHPPAGAPFGAGSGPFPAPPTRYSTEPPPFPGKLVGPPSAARTPVSPAPLDYYPPPPINAPPPPSTAGPPARDDFLDAAFAATSPGNAPLMQAIQLIGYHLAHKRANPAYPLPPALVFTAMQAGIPHDKLIDGVIWPSMRDRLVAAQNRFDAREVLPALLANVEVHGDDPLNPTNWELREPFLTSFSGIVDDHIVDDTNAWRRRRGEPTFAAANLPERPDASLPRSRSY